MKSKRLRARQHLMFQKILNGKRFPKQITLISVTSVSRENIPLVLCFYPLGNDFHPKGVAHHDNGANNYLIAQIVGDIAHETSVDLDLLHR